MENVIPAIPSPAAVDESFLTSVLRANGYAAEVSSFRATPVGTGQIGQCIRYTLDLSGQTAGCPTSLVGKFPSDDETSRRTGVALHNYLKEVRFYAEIRDLVSIRTPRCYYGAIEGEGPEFVLILEDLAPGEQGDQIVGCSADDASAAVLELVGLHAPTWNRDLSAHPWLDRRADQRGDPTADTIALYGHLLGPFLDRFGDRLQSDEKAIIERVATSTGPPWYPEPDHRALVHVDYRLDNILFDRSVHPPRVSVVDWQSVTVGAPLNDVAYFIGAGLLPEIRRPRGGRHRPVLSPCALRSRGDRLRLGPMLG